MGCYLWHLVISMGECQESLERKLKNTSKSINELVKELMDGNLTQNYLDKLNNSDESFNLDVLIGYLYQTLQGISFIDKAGIIHKDIACRNVILCMEGDKIVAKITDYGLAATKGIEKSFVGGFLLLPQWIF